MCICVGWLIFAMNFFTRKSMCILVPHTHLLLFCSSIFLHIVQSWSLLHICCFSNLFAHLLVFKLFAHLLFSHLPFSNCFVSLHIFLFFNLSFAHQLLFKLFAHVLQLFLIFVCWTIECSLCSFTLEILLHSLCSFTKNVKKNSYTCQLNSRQNSNQTIRF